MSGALLLIALAWLFGGSRYNDGYDDGYAAAMEDFEDES